MTNKESNITNMPTMQKLRNSLAKSAVAFDIFSKSFWYTLLVSVVYTLALLLTSVVNLRSQTQLIMLFFVFYAINIAIIILLWQKDIASKSFALILQHTPILQVMAIQMAIFAVSSLFMWAVGYIGMHTYGTWRFMSNYMWNSYFGFFTLANSCGIINFVTLITLIPFELSILTCARHLKWRYIVYPMLAIALSLAIISFAFGMINKVVVNITLIAISLVMLLATIVLIAIKGVEHERK